MLTSLAFSTTVSNRGYEWVPGADWFAPGVAVDEPRWRVNGWNLEGDETPRMLLRERGYRRESDDSRLVRPTSADSSLFRNFAYLDPTLEAIARFADDHGLLLGEEVGDPFAEWESEIRAMRFLIELWDEIWTGKLSAASKSAFTPNDKGFIPCQHTADFRNYCAYRNKATSQVVFNLPWRFEGRPFDVAKAFLRAGINTHLAAAETQILLSGIAANSLAVKPANLLTALWVQFAASISGEQIFERCEACGKFMELGLPKHRSDRKFCSNACRNRALRQRQKRAVELHESGRTVKQIASELESDTATVKKWLSPKKDK